MQLPLIGRVAAGSPILAQEHVEKQIPVDPSLFPDKPDYLLKVRGMSMKDIGIMDGDLLAVKKASTARAGQVVVARVNDDVTVKRFSRKAMWLNCKPRTAISLQSKSTCEPKPSQLKVWLLV